MNDRNEIMVAEKTGTPFPAPAGGSLYNSMQAFQDGQRIANALASSSLVPQEYRGNVANTLVALEMAQRTGSSPMAVMQNMHVIHGRPSWSSQFVIAALNSCGRFSPIRFRVVGTGDDETCVAWAYDKSTGDELEGPPVSIGMAKAEGWFSKNGSKWKTMPQLMLRYRAAKFFGNLYAPDVLMGMHSAEEIEDVGAANHVPVVASNDNRPQPAGGGASALNASAQAAPDPKPETASTEQGEPEQRIAGRLTYWVNRETGEFAEIQKGEPVPDEGETVQKGTYEEFAHGPDGPGDQEPADDKGPGAQDGAGQNHQGGGTGGGVNLF